MQLSEQIVAVFSLIFFGLHPQSIGVCCKSPHENMLVADSQSVLFPTTPRCLSSAVLQARERIIDKPTDERVRERL
ncbi:hypothetical protein V1508DRAFT_417706 [Lipomyces doorenjongii]|uniref:uncharacterized protein n=1 Tax=Lipomyces doorenjongii TaxID=383834 RepID=UPI0034CD16AF